MEEIYKDIKGYEGIYQISNLGSVKRLEYKRYNKKAKAFVIYKEHLLKPIINNAKGYKVVSLCKDGIIKIKTIHRLVAETFIPNSSNYKCVNHLDGNKMNNDISNLEWCTYSENIQHAYRIGLNKKNKEVNQYNLNGEYLSTYKSTYKASYETGINQSNIYMCCVGKRKRAGKYIWKFKNNKENKDE